MADRRLRPRCPKRVNGYSRPCHPGPPSARHAARLGTLPPALNPVPRNIGCRPRRKRGAGPNQWRCQVAELPPPPEGIVLAHFIVSDDVERSRRFYTEVLGGRVAFSGPGGLTYVALVQQLDHHQCRRRPDRRQAGGHPGDATRSRPGQQLPQYPGQRHRGRVRRMERPGCSIPDAAETAPVRDPLLHPRSRRSSDRSGANHGPSGGLDARSLAIEYTAEESGEGRDHRRNPPHRRWPVPDTELNPP